MSVVVLVLFLAGAVLALLAAVGIGAMGPFATEPLAISCVAGGLFVCHLTPSVRHV